MRYNLEDIEDQIIATLKADPALADVTIRTHAGEVSERTLLNPDFTSEFIANLPFIYVQYQGVQYTASDEMRRLYLDQITFRLYIGACSLREKPESQRSAYEMLRSVYDNLHGKVPLSDRQQLSSYPRLTGMAITTDEFNPQSALRKAPGVHEKLVVNLPGIVVYSTDYTLKLLA